MLRFFLTGVLVLLTTTVWAESTAKNLGSLVSRNKADLVALSKAKVDAYFSAAQSAASSVRFSRSFLDSLPPASGGKSLKCLSEALYFEARGETVKGQFAVAEVIMNRVASPKYPDTVCSVINQGTGRKYACQFTYTCDGRAEVIHEKATYARLKKIARIMLSNPPAPLTKGATHYHTNAVRPRWSRVFPRTATIGVHHFYRQPTRSAQN